MSTIQLCNEIKQLPRSEQILLAEWILKQSAKPHQISLSEAAAQMLHDYETDAELTAFTALDSEDIYLRIRQGLMRFFTDIQNQPNMLWQQLFPALGHS